MTIAGLLRHLFPERVNSGRSIPISTLGRRAPSHQNAIDLLPGWNHSLPDHFGLQAGGAALFNDPRIHWALEQFGDVAGRSILELGPLEAAHTQMLDARDPAVLDAVEAHTISYLRCLIAKEIYNLKHARFHLGNFVPWLKNYDFRYDLIVASGVLYHMADPIELIELIADRTDNVYLWTHYYCDEAMPAGDARAVPFLNRIKLVKRHGLSMRLHKRSYFKAQESKSFCGGPNDIHYWMEKDSIISLLKALGFDHIRVAHDEPGHQNGPCTSIFAKRSTSVRR